MDALLSSGCNDDARLAFHAEGAGNAEFVLRYAPRAGRGAAALGARREAAAQYEPALRFVPETDIRTRAELLYNQATAYCDVHDIGTFANCLLAERAGVFEKLGRWDDCPSITHTMLEERSLSPANRMQPLCYQAKVMARRRQDGFWPHLDEAMDLALGLDEPEWLSFVGLARVEAYWLEGGLDAARAELDRVRDVSAGVVVLSRGWIALWTRRLTGIAEPIDLEPFASQIAGDGAHAAELWDRLARTTTRAHPQGLTRREQEILQLLSEGESNEEIAGSLFISVRTVEHHVSAILGKLGATTRKGAANEALKLGLTHSDRVSVLGAPKSR